MNSPSDASARMIAEPPAADARFERLLAELSVGFAGIPATGIDAAIRHALEGIVSVLESDVGVVMEVAGAGKRVWLSHAYSRPGVRMDLVDFPEEEFPWLTGRVLAGEVIRLARIDDLPPDALDDRRSIEERDVRSAVVCPINVDGGVSGAVAFARVGHARHWPDDLVDRLCLVGQMFAGALARRRIEERLTEEREFATAAIESLPGLFFMLDEQGRLVRWNKNHDVPPARERQGAARSRHRLPRRHLEQRSKPRVDAPA